MADFTLIIANKRYSSWSLRAYLAMAATGAEFDEIMIPLGKSDSGEKIRVHNSSGLVPALHHGDFMVWDSLAIGEYLNEIFPQAELLPKEQKARARARSICAEMHSGFFNMRTHMSMNIGRRYKNYHPPQSAIDDVMRILDIWRDQISHNGSKFLFGDQPSLADFYFAPVVTRLLTYNFKLDGVCSSYADSIMAIPAMKKWVDDALSETEIISRYEYSDVAAA